jgi:hypothetical protein
MRVASRECRAQEMPALPHSSQSFTIPQASWPRLRAAAPCIASHASRDLTNRDIDRPYAMALPPSSGASFGFRRQSATRSGPRTVHQGRPVSYSRRKGRPLVSAAETVFTTGCPAPLTRISRKAHLYVKTPAAPRGHTSIRRRGEHGSMHRHLRTGGATHGWRYGVRAGPSAAPAG